MSELPDLGDVALPPTWFSPVARLVVTVARRRFECHVSGLEHVPLQGPVIVASNHTGYLDGPLLFSVLPRRLHALVKEDMFDSTLGHLLKHAGQIRVDRRNYDLHAVKQCLKVLERGGVLGIYPEGARGRGDVATTKGGAAYLALVSGAPIVPVACLGTRADGADTSSMPPRGSRLDTVFGAPLSFDKVPWPRTRKQVADVQAEVHRALATHVARACEMTGQAFPALPADS
ncbi:MAG: lysophospholipid acyltransferase family protein [Nocardioidaceae bacterium]